VRFRLDVVAEDYPSEEAEGELALRVAEGVQINSVDYLISWDVDVCGMLVGEMRERYGRRGSGGSTNYSEILKQTVADESTSKVEQDPHALIRHL